MNRIVNGMREILRLCRYETIQLRKINPIEVNDTCCLYQQDVSSFFVAYKFRIPKLNVFDLE